MDPITLENVAKKLDEWLDQHGKGASFEAKQALIPIRDFLLEFDPAFIKIMKAQEKAGDL